MEMEGDGGYDTDATEQDLDPLRTETAAQPRDTPEECIRSPASELNDDTGSSIDAISHVAPGPVSRAENTPSLKQPNSKTKSGLAAEASATTDAASSQPQKYPGVELIAETGLYRASYYHKIQHKVCFTINIRACRKP
jgi:hypothetical protein